VIQKLNTLEVRVKAVLLLLFLCVGSFGISQTYFSKVLSGWESSSFFETDSSYISFGLNSDFSINKNFIQINAFAKNDTNVLKNKIFIDSNTHTEVVSSASNSIFLNGNYYIAGGIADNVHLKGTIYKVQPSLDSFDIIYQNPTISRSRFTVIKAINDHLATLEIKGISGISGTKSATEFIMMDTFGNVKFSKSYSIPLYDIHLYPKDLVSTSDNGFLILCQEEEPKGQILGGGIKLFRATLIKTDSLGNEQWRKHLGDPWFNIKANNLIKAEDDTSYYVGWTNSDTIMRKWYPSSTFYDNWDIKHNSYTTLFLSKIGESGKTQWIKKYKTHINIPDFSINDYRELIFHYSPKMIKTKDNHLVAIGYYGALVKFTLDGEMVWYRSYIRFDDTLNYRDSDTFVKTFKETQDEGFILGGQYQARFRPIYQNAFAIKLDKYGCQFPDCHKKDKWYMDSVANAINKSNKGGSVLLYPNPTNDLLTIKLPASFALNSSVRVNIYGIKGKLIHTYSITDYTTQFSTSNLPKGIYIFQFSSHEMKEESVRVVVY
jgi:hypothetical protein